MNFLKNEKSSQNEKTSMVSNFSLENEIKKETEEDLFKLQEELDKKWSHYNKRKSDKEEI